MRAESALDGAILDVNLRGELVFPVADLLRENSVRVVFATGYEQWALPEAYATVPRCEKPVAMDDLVHALFDEPRRYLLSRCR